MGAFRDIEAHGIEPYEVVQVLSAKHRLPRLMRHPGGLSVLAVWGRTTTGRLLAVFVRRVGGFDAMILGARDLTSDEREEFEAWERSR